MFRIEIETANAAFEDNYGGEIARLLRVVIVAMEDGYAGGKLRDTYGNTVGSFATDGAQDDGE